MEYDKRQRDMIELITEKNKPLNDSIQGLNELLAESQADREKLNQIANVNTEMIENHEERIDDDNVRLTVLETENRIKKVIYREGNENK